MARPKKDISEKLTRRLPHMRCTESEYASIQARAAQTGKSMSAYVREMALKGKIVIKESKADFDLIQELNRIGINLNQLTRKANIHDEFPEGLEDVFSSLQEVLDKLLNPA